MRDYRKLRVWNDARSFVIDVYRLVDQLPVTERFGLSSQLRRSAVSIVSNIAEGCGRDSKRELIRYLEIASGSLSECECQILIALDLGYVDTGADLIDRTDHLRRQLHNLRVQLKGDVAEA